MERQALILKLEEAIINGDKSEAKKCAENLAELGAKVVIDLAKSSGVNEIRLKICIENKHSVESHLVIKISKSSNVGDLKTMVEEKFGFPRDAQRWMGLNRLLSDDEFLNDLKNLEMLNLYLICNYS